ncbi:RsmB/NOP family class I SAM-dependent RNA methyltransferase [Atopobium fossor]|uniref:RsmB/NOP family class I SAM-dependent RNA methyltransferase n=1 Tax=Atopobium fossor TaxID=39487 RepID=UPI000424B0FC|nr:transcription antitermination factor NusB [Atopobium fossor]
MGKAVGQQHSQATLARTVALSLLQEVRRREGHARDILRMSKDLRTMDARDVGFVQRLVLGVTLASGMLDTFINSHAIKPSKIQPQVRDALRVACYELCYLQTPAHTAVNQGVELARGVVPRAAAMVNAILHRVADQEVARLVAARQAAQTKTLPTIEDLTLVMAAPKWLVRQLVDSMGLHAVCDMALCAHEPAHVWVSANSGKHTQQHVQELLTNEGIKLEHTVFPAVWRAKNTAALTSSLLVKHADVVVSDLAPRMICYIASPQPRSTILEIGQGRATKSILLEEIALQMGAPAQLVGVDISPFKTAIATRRLEAGWSSYCQSLAYDACMLGDCIQDEDLFYPSNTLPKPLRRNFDVVFVDAPCSGTGTMRRHPEIAWTLVPEALQTKGVHAIPAIQLRMLVSAASRVQKDGALVYSTCSVLKQENEDVVQAFLQTKIGQHFELVSALDAPAVCMLAQQNPRAYELLSSCVTDEGMFRSHPQTGSFDGHFCARFVRRA